MTTRLFGRRVVVQIGTTSATGKEFEALRIGFDVQMKDGSDPNKAKLELYNVNKDTVALAQRDDSIVRLLVGYRSQGDTDRLCFEGNPIDDGVKYEKRGVDRVLTIEAADGGREYATAHISTSFSTATTSRQVFQAAADIVGLPLGNVDAVVGDVSFPHGINLNGPAREVLNRVAALSNARWQIRDRTLQFWKVGESTGENAVLFSADAGNLVGSPSVTKDGVEVTGLLIPTLRPGKPFRVQSEQVNGDYVATEVSFRGDGGWEREFYVKAKGKPLAA